MVTVKEDIASFIKTLTKAKVYDLAQPLSEKAPIHPADPPYLFTLYRHHDQTAKIFEGGMGFALEIIITSMHSSTHFDALSHISRNGKLYRGVDAKKVATPEGFIKYSMEKVPPIMAKGVLLDVARWKKKNPLPESYAITAKDLERTAKSEGVEIQKGDAVLIRTGYGALYKRDPGKYLHNHPGLGVDGAEWLAKRKVSLVGADNLALEATPTKSFPVHMTLIPDNGIHTVKSLYLEEVSKDRTYAFVFVVLPLKLVGATASLIRPIALKP
ncbi:MAG: cyclase family protein [Candidatus Bathyarchaeia archaeon]